MSGAVNYRFTWARAACRTALRWAPMLAISLATNFAFQAMLMGSSGQLR